MRVLAYRVERGLPQSALARERGMRQLAVARLESGVHEPTFGAPERLAQGLSIEFHIDMTPRDLRPARECLNGVRRLRSAGDASRMFRLSNASVVRRSKGAIGASWLDF